MGSSSFLRLRFSFSKVTIRFWRRILSKRSLIFASICAFYLFFALFGYSQQYQDKPADTDKHRHSRRLDTDARPDAVDSRTRAQNVLPTRNNVVYITLKSKRLKPANIRGTIRPKLRRKARRTRPPFTQNKFGSVGPNAGQNGRYVAQETFWAETLNVDYKSLNVVHDSHPDSRVSSIRIYSPKAPSWFSPEDVKAMRFLADAKVVRMKKMPQEDFSSLLIFESEEGGNHKTLEEGTLCGGRCGVIGSPVDNTEVFAFHLDRVLGLNRTLPAVSRKFSYLHGRSTKILPAAVQCVHFNPRINAHGQWWSHRLLSSFRWPSLPCCIMGCNCPPRGELCSEINLGGVPEYPKTEVFSAQERHSQTRLHLLHCSSLRMEQAGPVWLPATGNKERFAWMS